MKWESKHVSSNLKVQYLLNNDLNFEYELLLIEVSNAYQNSLRKKD